MRRALYLILFGLVLALPAAAAKTWTPDAKTIATLEAKVPAAAGKTWEFHPVDQYGRWYWGVVENGRRMIRGYFEWVRPECIQPDRKDIGLFCSSMKPRGIYVNEELPGGVFGGGCGYVSLLYDPQAERITELRCNPPR